MADLRKNPTGHRIDYERAFPICTRCGARYDDAEDWKPCVDGIIGTLIDALQAPDRQPKLIEPI